jgi:putative methyltransferase (TIGR04325 family)
VDCKAIAILRETLDRLFRPWKPRPAPAAPVEDADYSNADIINLVVAKTRRAAASPRIDEIIPGEGMLTTLLGAAISGDGVLDFGGAAGVHYFYAQRAFPDRPFRWAVVERPEMIEAAAGLASERLRFFSTIESAIAWLGTSIFYIRIAPFSMSTFPNGPWLTFSH